VNTRAKSIQVWRAAHQRVAAGGVATIPKTVLFPHPRDAGARPTVTWPVGQLADYALELEAGSAPLLIREFDNRFEAVVAGMQLAEQAVALAELNPRAAMYMGGALMGAVIGTAMTNKREGALVGAGVGLLIAALVNMNLRKKQEAV
jgi:Glycine zipper